MQCNVYKSVKNIGLPKRYIQKIAEIVVLRLAENKNFEMSVYFIGDAGMRRVNYKYRGMNTTTDVLSFAMNEGICFDNSDLGDIFISVPQIKRQARQYNRSYKEECVRMIVHGILHLFGYDHDSYEKEKKMFGIQEILVSEIRLIKR